MCEGGVENQTAQRDAYALDSQDLLKKNIGPQT